MSLEQRIEELTAAVKALTAVIKSDELPAAATQEVEATAPEAEAKPEQKKKPTPKKRGPQPPGKDDVISALKAFQSKGGNVPELLGKFGSQNVGALSEDDYPKVIEAAKEAA